MFHIPISLVAVIVNLAFFARCDTRIQPSRALRYRTDNNPNQRKWAFHTGETSEHSDKTNGKDNLAVFPVRPYPCNNTLQNKLYFYLYTKYNPTTPYELKINSIQQLQTSYFNARKPTVFITHGWINTANSQSCTLIRNAYLSGVGDVNVIVVDWSYFSLSLYSWSVESIGPVGKAIANMINWLKYIGYIQFRWTTLVGHSLGAHLMGVVGKNTNGVINQIFGLDPASISFEEASSKLRISKDCARQVQIIHTNGNQLGLLAPLGHSDFYANGGMHQPGCIFDNITLGFCSHGRAFEYFAESLNSPIGFKAVRCKVGQSPYNGECTGRVALMGGRSNYINCSGKYYTKTKSSPPYAAQLRRISATKKRATSA